MSALIIGLGSIDRRDDGAGLETARILERLVPRGTRVASLPGRETTLLELWRNEPFVIVIDAVVSGAAPGTVHVVDVSTGPLRLGTPPGSSHSFGLAAVIELGRVLGQLPERLIVVGIEAVDYGMGTGLSAAVQDGVHTAALCALEEVRSLIPAT